MNVTIINVGEQPVRVIVDHDSIHDATLEAGDAEDFNALEGIELRELETGEDEPD